MKGESENGSQDFEQIDRELDGEGYEVVASPDEDVELPTMRNEVPDTVPIPQEGADREEPDPSQYQEWSSYIHDLLEFEIGYQPDQAAVPDTENPGNPANNSNVLEGDLVDVNAGDHGIEVVYAVSDRLIEEAEYPIDSEDEMPGIWADVESTITVSYDADSFRELREETAKIATYLSQVDQAVSKQAQP